MTAIGLREANFPDEVETMALMQFIRSNYHNHTVGEIKMAFEMAIAGKLDVDAVSYENFSMAYFGKIMSAFRKWASQEHNQISRQNAANEAEYSKISTDSVDWSDEWAKLVRQAKNGKIRKEFINTHIYDWLMKMETVDQETGEITPKYQFTVREKWEAVCLSLEQYRREMKEAIALNEERGAVTPSSIRELVALMEVYEADADGNVIDQHPWKKNEVIMTTLKVMAKQELCRQIAVAEAAEL